RSAPVVRIPLHTNGFAGLPFGEDVRAGADGAAVVAVVLDDVLPVEHVLGQDRLKESVVDGGRLVPDHHRRVLVLHAAGAYRQGRGFGVDPGVRAHRV